MKDRKRILLRKGLTAGTSWLKKSFDPLLMALNNPGSVFETKNSNPTSSVLSRWVSGRTDVSEEKVPASARRLGCWGLGMLTQENSFGEGWNNYKGVKRLNSLLTFFDLVSNSQNRFKNNARNAAHPFADSSMLSGTFASGGRSAEACSLHHSVDFRPWVTAGTTPPGQCQLAAPSSSGVDIAWLLEKAIGLLQMSTTIEYVL